MVFWKKTEFKYRIVSEKTFVNAVFIIPNCGNVPKSHVLYIFPRYYNEGNNSLGWASKF